MPANSRFLRGEFHARVQSRRWCRAAAVRRGATAMPRSLTAYAASLRTGPVVVCERPMGAGQGAHKRGRSAGTRSLILDALGLEACLDVRLQAHSITSFRAAVIDHRASTRRLE